MRKLWEEGKFIVSALILWRFFLWAIEQWSPVLWPLREGFLGPSPWSNMDGVHYLAIVQSGYYQYEQAFFPLYPLLIRLGTSWTGLPPPAMGLVVSHAAFIIGLFFFRRIARELTRGSEFWSVVMLLTFPTSFFFAAVYSESLFFALATATLWFAQTKRWWLVGIAGALASGTRLFGVFLLVPVVWQYLVSVKHRRWVNFMGMALIPIGLAAYMLYLGVIYGDPLLFFHAQPAFGAGRSGEALILLPQVLWRYWRIITSVNPGTLAYAVALFELLALGFGTWLFFVGWRKRDLRPQLVYAALVLFVPTLTGTLSSAPRYFLSAFPLFFVLGSRHNTGTKRVIGLIFVAGLVFSTSLFLRGYFIA